MDITAKIIAVGDFSLPGGTQLVLDGEPIRKKDLLILEFPDREELVALMRATKRMPINFLMYFGECEES